MTEAKATKPIAGPTRSVVAIVADASRSELPTRSRGGVSELPTPRKSNMDPVSRVSSCLSRVSHTGVAGVVTVSRVSGASLFGLMTAYINLFIAIMPRYPGGKLQYCNITDLQ